jgi:hypothetical protein
LTGAVQVGHILISQTIQTTQSTYFFGANSSSIVGAEYEACFGFELNVFVHAIV